jgi:4-methyl-5(b-hydroxyethyl)-thiazole monophosphate biosynthesis
MVYVLLGAGFEELEAVAPCDILCRGGVQTAFAGVGGREITGAHGIRISADCLATEINLDGAEMIVIPGGLGGVTAIENDPETLKMIREAFDRTIELAAICAGPRVLAGLGILNGKRAVCYPGMERQMDGGIMERNISVMRDVRLTTGRGPGAAAAFGLKLLEVLRGKEISEKIAQDICYEG